MVRIKHRYLTFQILYPQYDNKVMTTLADLTDPSTYLCSLHRPSPDIQPQVLLKLIKSSVQYNYGDHALGLIAPSLKIVYFSGATSTGIIRVARRYVRLVWAGLTFLTTAGQTGGIVRVVRVCGTIKKAETDIIKRAKEEIYRFRSVKRDHDIKLHEKRPEIDTMQTMAMMADDGHNVNLDDEMEDEDMGVPVGD